LQVPESG